MKKTLVIAAAQTTSITGDIAANSKRHLAFIDEAARHKAAFLLFPELSLTGYDLELAAGMALPPDSPLLTPLHEHARSKGMLVVAGCPLVLADSSRPFIGALVLGGSDGPQVYAKQHLYGSEQTHFAAGTFDTACRVADAKVALAICADIVHPEHVAKAARAQADIYAAGMLITENGYPAESAMLQHYAMTHHLCVLIANHGGPTGAWNAIGRSACWDEDGGLIADVPGEGEYLLIAAKGAAGWSGQVIDMQ